MKLANVFTHMIFAAALPVAAMAAPACGSTVSGKVVLDADMTCVGTTGLVIGGDNTTIDLNGHTMSCTGAGYLGSCQADGGPLGIVGSGKKNVMVKGPGKIVGFTGGVYLSSTSGSTVRDLDVSGPPSPGFWANPRPFSAGIWVIGSQCSASGNVVTVQSNNVSNQAAGIYLGAVSCAKLTHNYLSGNSADTGYFTGGGIILHESSKVSVDSNTAERNGSNETFREAGILVYGASALNNTITNNISRNNCGDGILVAVAPAGSNVVRGNTMRNNATSDQSGFCGIPAPGTFFDLAEREGAAGNTYTKTNVCQTQSTSIPAGVCNAGE